MTTRCATGLDGPAGSGKRRNASFADPANAIQQKEISVSTKAQQIYEAVTRLVDEGLEQADAFRKVAADTGLKFDSVRGAFYSARRAANGEAGKASRRSRKRETTPEDAVASAVAALETAIESIQVELDFASQRAREAVAEYEALKASSGPRIEEIRSKITVLAPSASKSTPTGGGGSKS